VDCAATMVLGGRDQMTFPAEARDLAERLDARTVQLDAGHAVMTESPDALQKALVEALV